MLINVILRAGLMLVGALLASYFLLHGMNEAMQAAVSPLVGALQ